MNNTHAQRNIRINVLNFIVVRCCVSFCHPNAFTEYTRLENFQSLNKKGLVRAIFDGLFCNLFIVVFAGHPNKHIDGTEKKEKIDNARIIVFAEPDGLHQHVRRFGWYIKLTASKLHF